MIKEILLVFKTHLDIGYTDYAANVKEKYLREYLPAAVRVARASEHTEHRFVWTTGSWLIAEALKEDDGTLESAIRDGLITWHALPFTSHTEYMNCALMEYALDISAELDRRFGKKTIAAKMTDVPGHTVALVPMLCRRGIELLHIGVNPATPLPDVPEVFYWKCGDDQIAVIYNRDYGEVCELGDFALAFGFTGDNHGPQGGEQLADVYRNLQEKYPDAVIRAATLDEAAERMRGLDLPVVEGEIGDNWIHGVGTDPTKTRLFREILRRTDSFTGKDINNNLLLVPEHTWGLCLQTKFPNSEDWTPAQMKVCTDPQKDFFAGSWDEQRAYVTDAAKTLGVDLTDAAEVSVPDTSAMTAYDGQPRAKVLYQLFDRSDFDRYINTYLRMKEGWAIWDFTKNNLPDYRGGIYSPHVTAAWESDGTRIFRMEFDEEIRTFTGLPTVWLIETDETVELRWFGKGPNRIPEAYWLQIPEAADAKELYKLGMWIDPTNAHGMRDLHAVWAVRGDKYEVEPLDTALAAPFGPRLLHWQEPIDGPDLYFNLYNNIWNTNFPMWFSDDAKFRFVIRQRRK